MPKLNKNTILIQNVTAKNRPHIARPNPENIMFNFGSMSQFIGCMEELYNMDKGEIGRYHNYVGVKFGEGENTSWFGYTNRAMALDMLKNGWHEGLERLSLNLTNINVQKHQELSGYQWQDQGLFFDVGAMLTGEPDHWLEPEYQPARKVVKVIVNIGQLSSVGYEAVIRRGAVTVSLVQQLEEMGYIVELVAVSYARVSNSQPPEHITVTIPIGTTPIDMLELAYISGHVSMLRHHIFTIRETILPKNMNGGRCSTRDLPSIDKNDVIYIGCAGGNLAPYSNSNKEAVKWIESELNRISK